MLFILWTFSPVLQIFFSYTLDVFLYCYSAICGSLIGGGLFLAVAEDFVYELWREIGSNRRVTQEEF
jgi:hypothetical protein